MGSELGSGAVPPMESGSESAFAPEAEFEPASETAMERTGDRSFACDSRGGGCFTSGRIDDR